MVVVEFVCVCVFARAHPCVSACMDLLRGIIIFYFTFCLYYGSCCTFPLNMCTLNVSNG
jgi:hypothetical protein